MKKLISSALLGIMLTFPFAGVASAFTPLNTQQAIAKYHQYYSAYTKDELVKVAQYRQKYANMNGSLADQIVERAIWYMDNGYAVYGHGHQVYGKTGIVDCSNFTSMVYGDFGYNITSASRRYNTVGTAVGGVYAKKVGSTWTIQGTQNLRPGDLLTWWAKDANGVKYISHVAIYMGMLNGQPAVIGTRGDGNPTALGIVNDFRHWWGSNFAGARRVLPNSAWTPGVNIAGHSARRPVIPTNPVLPPQKSRSYADVSVKGAPVSSAVTTRSTVSAPAVSSSATSTTYVTPQKGWVSYFSGPSLKSAKLGRLQIGQKAVVLKKYNKYYYQIRINGRTAYITTNPTYVRVSSTRTVASRSAVKTNYVVPQSGWVSYHSQPKLSSPTLGRLQLGQAAVIKRTYNKYWYEISINGTTAYITTNSKYVRVVTL